MMCFHLVEKILWSACFLLTVEFIWMVLIAASILTMILRFMPLQQNEGATLRCAGLLETYFPVSSHSGPPLLVVAFSNYLFANKHVCHGSSELYHICYILILFVSLFVLRLS